MSIILLKKSIPRSNFDEITDKSIFVGKMSLLNLTDGGIKKFVNIFFFEF